MGKLLSIKRLLFIAFCSTFTLACQTAKPTLKNTSKENLKKLDFDIHELDDDGLIGPPTGKVSIDYQFCIPSGEAYLEKVLAIDPDLKQMRKYIGREGCLEGHVAMMGSTHKPRHKEILLQLAALDFIEKIERVWWL